MNSSSSSSSGSSNNNRTTFKYIHDEDVDIDDGKKGKEASNVSENLFISAQFTNENSQR